MFFFVGMGAAVTAQASGSSSALLVVALAHGLVLAALVSALGYVSGGHFNPAVTFGVWVAGKIDNLRAALYMVAQIVGGVLAAVVLAWVVFPSTVWSQSNLGLPALGQYTSAASGATIEAILSVILVLTVLGTAVDPRAPRVGGLFIGLVVGVDILMAGPLTGAAMNPARWIAPAVVSQTFDNGWVWIVGPLVGGLIAGLLYRLFAPVADLGRTPGLPEGEPERVVAAADRSDVS